MMNISFDFQNLDLEYNTDVLDTIVEDITWEQSSHRSEGKMEWVRYTIRHM